LSDGKRDSDVRQQQNQPKSSSEWYQFGSSCRSWSALGSLTASRFLKIRNKVTAIENQNNNKIKEIL